MKTVRQQVLDYIETHRAASAEDIARAFKMTGANARYHLSVLMDEGAVEIAGIIQDGSIGRPRQRYCPARQMHRHNLDRLAHALLAMKTEQGETELWVGRLADQIWVQDAPGNTSETNRPAAENLTHRLARAVRKFNHMNYDARWEAHAQAPRIFFNHCPYQAIITEHPELCRLDALLLQKALNLPVSQQIKLGKDAHGLSFCLFVVGGQTMPTKPISAG